TALSLKLLFPGFRYFSRFSVNKIGEICMTPSESPRKIVTRVLRDLSFKVDVLELNLLHIKPLVAHLSKILDVENLTDSDLIVPTAETTFTVSTDLYSKASESKDDVELLRTLGFNYVPPSTPTATKEALHNMGSARQSEDALERDKIFKQAELKEKEDKSLWGRLVRKNLPDTSAINSSMDPKFQAQSTQKQPPLRRRDIQSVKKTANVRNEESWRNSAKYSEDRDFSLPDKTDTVDQRMQSKNVINSYSSTREISNLWPNQSFGEIEGSSENVASVDNSFNVESLQFPEETIPQRGPTPILKPVHGLKILGSDTSVTDKLSSLDRQSKLTPTYGLTALHGSLKRKGSTVMYRLANAAAKAKYDEKGSLLSVTELERNAMHTKSRENPERLTDTIEDIHKTDRLWKYGLNPRSSFKVYFELIMGVFYIIVAWIIPLEVGFNTSLHWSFSIVLVILFTIDTALEALTLRASHPALSSVKTPSLKDWQAHYFSHLFWIDLISTFPFEFLSVPGADYMLAIHLLRLYKLPNILIYSPKFIAIRKALESALGIGQTFSGIFPLMFALCIFLHIETCAIFLVGNWADFSNAAIAQVQFKSLGDQYTWALFNAVGNTFPMTYKPISSPEQLVVLVFIVTGAGLYACIVGTVSSFAMGLDASGRLYKQKIDELHEYMRWRDLSDTTRRKVMKYYEIKYRGKFFEEATLLNEMNESLRMEIAIQNCKELIQKVSFLRRETGDGRDELFLGRIATALTACYFVAGDIILTQGEIGVDMFFILSGMVDIVVNGKRVVQFSDGAFFGEVALIANIPRTATVQAASSCAMYRLTRADFMSILSEFQDMRQKIDVIYNERMLKVKQEEEQRRASSGPPRRMSSAAGQVLLPPVEASGDSTLSLTAEVISEILATDEKSIWHFVLRKDPDHSDVVRFVKAAVWSKLLDTLETTEPLAQVLKSIRNDPQLRTRFCLKARQIEDEIWSERGPEGETILHYALMLKHEKLIDFLLSGNFDRLHLLINAVYEKEQYWGEHACHLAVVRYGDNPEKLKLLIDKGADLFVPRARGTFFCGDEEVNSHYMGETVLAFAAMMGHQKIVNYLIYEVEVDPNILDNMGNNVLHVMAWHGFYDNNRGLVDREHHTEKAIVEGHIYHQLESGIVPSNMQHKTKYPSPTEQKSEYHPFRADDSTTNLEGLTPFLLAVNRNQVEMVEAILNYKSVTLWTYGAACQKRICLSEIDTYIDRVTMAHEKSALAIAIRKGLVDIIKIPIFSAVLESKWSLYGGRMFHFRFWSNLLYMVCFTVALFFLPNDQEFLDLDASSSARIYDYQWPQSGGQIFRMIMEFLILIVNLYLFIEAAKQLRNGYAKEKSIKKVLSNTFLKGFSWIHNQIKYTNFVIIVIIVILRVLRKNSAETVFLMAYAILGWLQHLYYYRGFKDIGPLSIVFIKIIQNDAVNFAAILFVVLCGFSSSLWLQMAPFGSNSYENGGSSDDADWRSLIPGGLVWGIRLFFALGTYDEFRNASSWGFAVFLYMLFFFSVNIILLNVFIGMVNSTFGKVLDEAENKFILSRAMLLMELDELILAKFLKSSRKDKSIHRPVSRIGIPRKTDIINKKESGKQQEKEDKIKKGAEKNRGNSYFEYIMEISQDLYLEFHGEEKAKHIVSSLDPRSPYSEIGRQALPKEKQFGKVVSRRAERTNQFIKE
ncbi:anaphase-promoting complex subunit Hcn1, partial [Entophlyctis luteolus]